MVVTNSLLLPLLGPEARPMWAGIRQRLRKSRAIGGGMRSNLNARWFAIHLVISVVLSQGLLYGYRLKNPELTGFPPAYLYADGPLLLGDWAPIVQPIDVPDPALRKKIFDALTVPLKPRAARDAHHFAPGGAKIDRRGGDQEVGWQRRCGPLQQPSERNCDSCGGTRSSWPDRVVGANICRLLNTSYFLSSIELDEGAHHQVSKQFSDEIWKRFHARYQQLNPGSLTQRWHHAAVPWYLFLLFVPLIFTCLAIVAQRLYAPQYIFLGIMAWAVVLQAAALSAGPIERYLVPLAWLVFPMMGAVATSCARRWSAGRPA